MKDLLQVKKMLKGIDYITELNVNDDCLTVRTNKLGEHIYVTLYIEKNIQVYKDGFAICDYGYVFDEYYWRYEFNDEKMDKLDEMMEKYNILCDGQSVFLLAKDINSVVKTMEIFIDFVLSLL